jgi:hypothetical protein
MRLLGIVILLVPALVFADPSGDMGSAPNAPSQLRPPSQPAPSEPDPWAFHHGFTFDASLGLGSIGYSNSVIAGPDFGAGGWLFPQLAVTVRFAGIHVGQDGVGSSMQFFVGPALQYWVHPHFWLGAGAGYSIYRACTDDYGCHYKGYGFDLRAGYTFGTSSTHTFNVSIEANPGLYSPNDSDTSSRSVTATGIAFLAGYQFL